MTKLLTAYAVLVAVEEGAVEWDAPAGPDGATVRHLAAHASGLAFDTDAVQAAPGTKRIYSNTGFAVLGAVVADAAGMPFADYLHEGVCVPLGLGATRLDGHPGSGAVSTCADLARFAAELQAPTLVDPSTLGGAVTVAFPGLDGILPGYGRQRPNDWGLGFEIRDGKSPHWTGAAAHRARSGTSGSPARSCGSTRTRERRASRCPTATSDRGRSRRGRRSRTGFSRPWNRLRTRRSGAPPAR